MRPALRYYYYSGSGGDLTESTEAELLAHIMANFPPNFFLDPEQGIVDSSGNGVAVSTVGAPTLNQTGGQNNRGYIAFDGIDDGVLADRVDVKTMAMSFKDINAANGLFRVPQNNSVTTGVQGMIYTSGLYEFRPHSEGTIKPTRSELTNSNSIYRNFVARGTKTIFNNGQRIYRLEGTLQSQSTATKMSVGFAANGAGGGGTQFNQMELGLLMVWNTELTDDQLYIVHAFIEKRFNSYAKVTYQYSPTQLTMEATNPIIDGNVNSASPSNQAYPPQPIKVGSNFYMAYKQLDKDIGASSSSDGISWTDEAVVVASGSTGEFDVNGINNLVFFKLNTTYYIIYSGRNASSEYQIGYATSSSPISGYTKQGLLISLADVNTPLSKSYTQLLVTDICKIDGVYHLYMTCSSGAGESEPGDIVVIKSDDLESWSNPEIILTYRDTPLKPGESGYAETRDNSGLPYECAWLEFGGIVLEGGKYCAMISAGKREVKTENWTKLIYPCVSDDGINWKVLGGPNVVPGADDEWNESRTYFPSIMKQQDGLFSSPEVVNNQWHIYFASGTRDTGAYPRGIIGLAYAPLKIIDPLL